MKYLYTDPLAAAYMAREFGVELCDDSERTVRVNPTELEKFARIIWSVEGTNGWLDYEASDFPKKIYINPDSEHIFEPREGDLVGFTFMDFLNEEASFQSIVLSIRNKLRVQIIDASICDEVDEIVLDKLKHLKMIQRDGKPFFNPEREET